MKPKQPKRRAAMIPPALAKAAKPKDVKRRDEAKARREAWAARRKAMKGFIENV
jgi:hypothetical protein